MTAALRFNNLTLGYDRHPAVHHLSGEVGDGALMAVVGPTAPASRPCSKALSG
jgi:zinc/manganese transport system ATP-binding protein